MTNLKERTPKKSKIRKNSLRPYPKLKKEAEKWVHWYVRLRDCLNTTKSLHHGKCYTCGVDTDMRYFQAGHFRHGKLDFDENNLHGQCVRCNKWLSGNLGIYAVKLINDYGKDFVDDLIFRSNQTKKYTRDELEEIIKTYKFKVLELTHLHNAL